ncbi:carbohydrate ABC transporter membrane protein 2, CUT1 family [Streptomyces sp. DvalAA-14]|uniref:carbohydrate ABC transporter permease n=2 Tax=unclassified Streptomyces TaxID=2593676 RepID=UPI00081BC3C4|nr:ABC transporter permease subunit [Streptomyces sp. SID4948]SCD94880.1 carbohydrate ABC transporter membrane protein 2, CUT1 family [Streptomyces sp. DvalAA-14]
MSAAAGGRPGQPPTRRPGARARRARGPVNTAVGVLILAVMLFPLYWMLNASLLPSTDLVKSSPTWFPLHGTFQGYRNALSSQGGHLLVSLGVSAGTVVLVLLIAVPAAYGLAQLRAPGGRLLTFALLIAQMIPGVVMANSFYTAANRLHLLNSPLALILADSTLCVPFAALILQTAMRGVPAELSEAAVLDGAGRIRTLLWVILPVTRNAVITAGLFSFLFAWADFLFAVTLTTQDDRAPVTVGIYRFIGAHLSDWNSVMATGIIASLPAAVLLVVAQRYVAAGVTSGAVKD